MKRRSRKLPIRRPFGRGPVSCGSLLPLGAADSDARKRLDAIGLKVMPAPGSENLQVLAVGFGSQAEKLGIEQGFDITAIEMPSDRPAKEWMFLPALLVLGLVVMTQRRRKPLEEHPAAA